MEIHLAPLENVSCWSFRNLCKGQSDSYTGMLSLTNLVKRNSTWDEVDTYTLEGQRQWIQFATSKESECASFLQKLEEEVRKHPEKDNIYGIQLNASCPSPQLIQIGQGPALIKRSTKVCTLLKELLKQDRYNVGIKLRLGLNAMEVRQGKIFTLLAELEKLAKEYPRFTNVTIHFKHAQETSSKEYDYSLLNEVTSYEVPLILNGGIRGPNDVEKLLSLISLENRKNVRGVMIAREALRNPDCFLEFANGDKKKDIRARSSQEIRNAFKSYCAKHMPKPIYLSTIQKKCMWMVS